MNTIKRRTKENPLVFSVGDQRMNNFYQEKSLLNKRENYDAT